LHGNATGRPVTRVSVCDQRRVLAVSGRISALIKTDRGLTPGSHVSPASPMRAGPDTVPVMAEIPEPLEPIDESWSTALAVVAHPDDLEYGASAAIARWTGQGKRVVYCLATSGEAGIDSLDPEKCGPLREEEERASAAAVGVGVVEFLGYADGMIEYGLPLRRDIARAIRRHRPDVVITGNYQERWGFGGLNQADHVAVGRAVVDGARDAGNRWVFRDLLDEGLPAWSVKTLYVAGSPLARHGVDVTDTFDAGVAALEAHQAYLTGLGPSAMADPREFLESMARPTGTRLGATFGVAFEVLGL
jgi:LmbE family N-acetylglucosaminyl deacetylase